jgi:hypothetical protein
MRKDLILITSYTPDEERENLLLDLLGSIDRNTFDIMISSHSSVSKRIIEICDFFLFQKKNTLLTEPEYKFTFWFGNGEFEIRTTEFKDYNHIIAAGSLILNGLSSANGFGYEKVHFLEYDSLILDSSEFLDNSRLLDDHSIVWYKHPRFNTAFSLISFNLKKIDESWFSTEDDLFYSFLNESRTKTLESFNLNMINKKDDHFMKEIIQLEGKIETCRYTSDDPDSVAVIGDRKNGDFWLFNHNRSGSINDVSVIVNDSYVKKIINDKKDIWVLRSIGKIDEVNIIKIILNGKVIRNYDFNELNKNEYIKRNKIEYNDK